MAYPTVLSRLHGPVKEIVDRMINEGFQFPLLVSLDTNPKQLYALQEVRESTSTDYKALEEEENRFNKKLRSFLKSNNRGSVSFTQGEPAIKHANTSQWAPPPPQDRTVNVYFQ